MTRPLDGDSRVLYLSHNGLTEPLGRRQVLPYLVGLSARGWRFSLISFEKDATNTVAQRAVVEQLIRAAGIDWRPLKYHHRPPVLATAFDVMRGSWLGRRLGRTAKLIHARSSVPALMARRISRGSGEPRVPWVFDVRGLIAEEYVDAGHWKRGGLRQRVTADVERQLLEQADGLVTLTHRIVERLPRSATTRPSAVIPCSVDLATFQPSMEWRRAVRRELGLNDAPLLVYSGSLGSWYRLEEMLDYFETACEAIAGLRFLLLTPQAAGAAQAADSRGLAARVVALSLEADEVPRHLAAADAGICFLGRHGSKVASSPTKFAEYLAAGLPVITNSWIGDAAALSGEQSWILVDDFSEAAYRQAAARLSVLLTAPAATRAASRALAEREFALEAAIDRYDALYRQVLAR